MEKHLEMQSGSVSEDEEMFRDLCDMNGIQSSKLSLNNIDGISSIEVLFSPFNKLSLLSPFTYLRVLRVLKCDVYSLDGLNSLNSLEEIYVVECDLKVLCGLENCLQLRSLYLYGNKISKIEGLTNLRNLEILWLNSNMLTKIEGLNELKKIRELNLAENKIQKIGNSLDQLSTLENLDMSANELSSFQDLTNLAKLPKLRSLSLKDASCGPNPVCMLCNCTTHVLYHMPTLIYLDTQIVTAEVVHDIESIVLKKKMYYNMRIKAVRRKMTDVMKNLERENDRLQEMPMQKLRNLYRVKKSLERRLDEVQSNLDTEKILEMVSNEDENANFSNLGNADCDYAELNKRLEQLNKLLHKWHNFTNGLENHCKSFRSRIKAVEDASIGRLALELESGGNVRFEDGVPSDPWFLSCRDLVLSRFCASSLKPYDIQSVKVLRISRLHNRMLRLKFDAKVDVAVDDYQTKLSSQYKKKFEYLFYTWKPSFDHSCRDRIDLFEHGFPPNNISATRKCTPMTNSVSVADKSRLVAFTNSTGKRICDLEDARNGQLLVCKVFLGNTAISKHVSDISPEKFPNVDSIFHPLAPDSFSGRGSAKANVENFTSHNTKVDESLNTSINHNASSNPFCSGSNAVSNSKGDCDCINRQCDWFIFDSDLIVPEYIVDFQYNFSSKSTSPFSSLSDGVNVHMSALIENRVAARVNDPLIQDDEVILAENLQLNQPARFVSISEEILLKVVGHSNFANIVILNLHNCGISRGKQVPSLPNIKRLIISFNELSRLDDFGKMGRLEYLDASFNKLNSLEGMKSLMQLSHLDVSWNELTNNRDDVAILRKHATNIVTLRLCNNPWKKVENLRLRIIGRLKYLQTLDDVEISDAERTAAAVAAASARVSPVALVNNGRTDTHRPRSLSLAPYAEILYLNSKKKPERISESPDTSWLGKITCLYLDSQHLSKISNLERLENLKYVTMRNNDITKIEGLDGCINLEELSLDRNCIPKLEGLSKLTKLKRLSLSHNLISSIEQISVEALSSLYYLSLENNKIEDLSSFQKATCLMEFYFANNSVSNIRETFHLKSCPNLVILDLFGNPIANEIENYRHFVIYHLKSLKALDGTAISNSDLNQAREYFGGKLTLDFVADKLRLNDFSDVREIDFPNCSLRQVDLGNTNLFIRLRSLNLEHNNLSSLSGLLQLDNLQVLCLNYNKIECLLDNKSRYGANYAGDYQVTNTLESMRFNLPRLEVLHLGYNSISEISRLQLECVPSVRSLFLQGNEITEVDGLQALTNLRDLVLDRNKIKAIGEHSFVGNRKLLELHLEDNRLRELSYISTLQSLQRLYLANNRIQDMAELDKLESLPQLIEVNLTNNAISRRLLHRPILVFRQPNLQTIDGIPVTDEERQKADMYFLEEQPMIPQQTNIPQIQMTDSMLPGITVNNPLKVTNVQIGSAPGQHFGLDDSGGSIGGARNKQPPKVQPHGTVMNGLGQRVGGNVNMTTNARLYRKFFQSPPK